MRAVAYTKALPTCDAGCFIDIEIERQEPLGFDLLVEIHAVSVNPVDVKRRARDDPAGAPRVLGYDAAGVVIAADELAQRFHPGDAVYYAGSLLRPGTNSQFHLADERLVGRKPASLSFAEAAALPLTALTAWELMFERIGLRRSAEPDKRVLLLVGGAGGVGSIAIQLARQLTGLTVIATASRLETRDWCLAMGAHHVIDHSQSMTPQLRSLGFRSIEVILGLNGSDRHLPEIAELIAPLGHVGLIDDAKGADFGIFKSKSVSLHWEFMFTRSSFSTPDMARQGAILDELSALVDVRRLKSTLRELVGPIDAEHLRVAHRRLESGHAYGKIVLAQPLPSSGYFV